ncbi:MAG: C-terminal helicase domain-containing protein, partial [Hyphomicrobiales bacterium]
LFRSLDKHGFQAGALHGDMDQFARTTILENFRAGKLPILVASDVAARGLDIPDVSHVFNFDVPFNAEDYVHRIGRTGRAGRLGTAYTLVSQDDERNVSDIVSLIKQDIEWLGDAVDFEAEREKRPRKRGGGRGRNASTSKSQNSKTPAKTDAAKNEDAPKKPSAKRKPNVEESKPKKEASAKRANNPKEPNQGKAEKPIIGLGDHVPDFLMRPIKGRKSA